MRSGLYFSTEHATNITSYCIINHSNVHTRMRCKNGTIELVLFPN